MKNTLKVLSLAGLVAVSCGQAFAVGTVTANVPVTMTVTAAPAFGTVTGPSLGTISYSGTTQVAQINTDNTTTGSTVSSILGPTRGNVTATYAANSFTSLVISTSTQAFAMTTGDGDQPTLQITGNIGVALQSAAGATIGSTSATCDASQSSCAIYIGAATNAIANSQIAGSYSTAGSSGSPAVLTLTYS